MITGMNEVNGYRVVYLAQDVQKDRTVCLKRRTGEQLQVKLFIDLYPVRNLFNGHACSFRHAR